MTRVYSHEIQSVIARIEEDICNAEKMDYAENRERYKERALGRVWTLFILRLIGETQLDDFTRRINAVSRVRGAVASEVCQ